jgi:hypothetical protein
MRTPFGTSSPVAIKQLPPRPKVNESEITEVFLKGSGPGGQKIVTFPADDLPWFNG